MNKTPSCVQCDIDVSRQGSSLRNHWITSSARSSTACGIVRPSAFAAVRLIPRTNLVGCCIGFQHASTYDQETHTPGNGTSPGREKVTYGLWSIPSFQCIDTEFTERHMAQLSAALIDEVRIH
jgi:hypothetical protein